MFNDREAYICWYFFCLTKVMKIAITFFWVFLASWNISKCQSAEDIRHIEFSKESRGYQEHILITPDSLRSFMENAIAGNGPVERSRKVTPVEWSALLSTLEGVNLRSLDELPSPSMRRASDAAMHGTITITTKGGDTYSHGFDDEEPNEVLRPLILAIREIAGPGEKP